MLSAKTIRHIETLLDTQGAYMPNDAARLALSKKTLLMLVGPTGAGKSTVMKELAKLHPQISVVGTITTRSPRPDDQLDRYTFYEHTDEGLQPLFDDIAAGRLVQYVVNPYSHQIYGSAPSDYPGEVNVGDYFSSVVEPFHAYGFGRIIPVTVVTTAESWLRRFDERFPPGHPQRESRRIEAITSLKWSLGTHQIPHYFVLNPEGKPENAARDIAATLVGGETHQDLVQTVAQQCLHAIRRLKP